MKIIGDSKIAKKVQPFTIDPGCGKILEIEHSDIYVKFMEKTDVKGEYYNASVPHIRCIYCGKEHAITGELKKACEAQGIVHWKTIDNLPLDSGSKETSALMDKFK